DQMVALADKMMTVLDQTGKDLSAAGKDCKKAAAAIKQAAANLQPIKEEGDKLKDLTTKDPEVKKWFEANYQKKIMDAMMPLMQVAQTCGKDPGFTAAMKEMDMGGKKDAAAKDAKDAGAAKKDEKKK